METYHADVIQKMPPPLYQRQVITRLNCEENLTHAELMDAHNQRCYFTDSGSCAYTKGQVKQE